MLTNLSIRDFAIVDRIDVEFSAGMTVLTGETGAGKSILIDALGLVLGDRGSAQLVRKGAKRAELAAGFDLSGLPAVQAWLETQTLDADDECLLRRVIGADGRSRAFVNGNAVPLQQLRELGDMLVDIHGQHFHQSLGRRAVQRELLDHYAGAAELRAATAAACEDWHSLAERHKALTAADADRNSRLDLLTFQLQELEALSPEDGEFEDLSAERQRLASGGRLLTGVTDALDRLSENDGANATGLIAAAFRELETLCEIDGQLGGIAELLDSAAIQLAEAREELQRYRDAIDMDPARQDWVEERLDSMATLARKHRITADRLPEKVTALHRELDELANAEARGRELEQALAAARTRYLEHAGKLSDRRRSAAESLSAEVGAAMAGLGMPGGQFLVEITDTTGPGDDAIRPTGIDAIEFLISANPGQAPMPLARVASGGELSRMSLAIQVIVSDGSAIPTMVFDEVDSGVGGGVAEMVGRRLFDLGTNRQVLCVTHLPQVASLAHQHLRISKVTDGKATRTGFTELDKQERVEELARRLGGVEITQTTLDHAAEMLAGAPQKRA